MVILAHKSWGGNGFVTWASRLPVVSGCAPPAKVDRRECRMPAPEFAQPRVPRLVRGPRRSTL